MQNKLILTALGGMTLLAACATPSTTFQNAAGETTTCSASGFGVFGAPSALLLHASCVEKMQAAGYRAVDKNTVAPQPSPDAANLAIALPDGWERKPLTEVMASDGGSVYALNPSVDAGVFVSAAKREGVTDLMAYAASRRSNQEARLLNPQSTDIVRFDINGKLALRFEVSGFVKGGMKVTYLYTIIEGDKQLAVVNAWTGALKFAQYRQHLESLAYKVSGLS